MRRLQRRRRVPAPAGAVLAGAGAPRALQPHRIQRSQLLRPGHCHHALHHGQLACAAAARKGYYHLIFSVDRTFRFGKASFGTNMTETFDPAETELFVNLYAPSQVNF